MSTGDAFPAPTTSGGFRDFEFGGTGQERGSEDVSTAGHVNSDRDFGFGAAPQETATPPTPSSFIIGRGQDDPFAPAASLEPPPERPRRGGRARDTGAGRGQDDPFAPATSLEPPPERPRRGSTPRNIDTDPLEFPEGLGGGGAGREDLGGQLDYEAPRERRRRQEDAEAAERQRQEELGASVARCEAVLATDREVSQSIRRELHDLGMELQQVQDVESQVQKQTKQQQEKHQHMAQRQRQLERQVQEAKQHLHALCEARRAVSIESLSLRRDRCHLAEELTFLQRLAEDEERAVAKLHGVNDFLETCHHDRRAHSGFVDQQRRDLVRQLSEERELVRSAERENAEMRNRLERVHREQLASAR